MQRTRRDVVVVAGVAVLARLVVAAWLARDPAGLSDPAIYRAAAGSIAAGDGYASLLGRPTAYYPPGYPFLLGAQQWFVDALGRAPAGGLVVANAVTNALLGGVAAGALVLAGGTLARSLGVGDPWARRTGLVAGAVVALWPNLVVYASTMLSESLSVALGAVALAALLRWTQVAADAGAGAPLWGGGAAAPAAVAALSVGAGALVRPQASLVAVPAVAVAWWLGGLGRRRVLAAAGLLALGVAAFVLPWTVRNAVVMGAPVPLSTNTGDNLCIGFHDGATGGFLQAAACATEGRYVDGPAVEVPRDGVNRDRAVRWVLDHPGELPWLSLRKLWITYGSDRDGLAAAESYGAGPLLGDGTRRVVGAALDAVWVVLAGAAALGALSLVLDVARGAARRSPTALTLLVLTALGALVPVAFFGDPRFKFGVGPQLALLAAWGICVAWRAVLARGPRRRGHPEPEAV